MRRKDVKIGMRVIATCNIDGKNTLGKEATVVSTDADGFWNICVEFDQKIDFWVKNRVCWCNGRHIEPIPEEAVEEITLPFAELMLI